jgi:hypothetical protein
LALTLGLLRRGTAGAAARAGAIRAHGIRTKTRGLVLRQDEGRAVRRGAPRRPALIGRVCGHGEQRQRANSEHCGKPREAA